MHPFGRGDAKLLISQQASLVQVQHKGCIIGGVG